MGARGRPQDFERAFGNLYSARKWVAERACAMAERTRLTAERSRSALRLRDRILHGNYRACCRKQWSCHRDRARAIARVPGRKNLRHVSHVEVIAGDATTY